MKAPGKPFMKAKNYCLFTYQFFGRILNDKLFNLFKWKKKNRTKQFTHFSLPPTSGTTSLSLVLFVSGFLCGSAGKESTCNLGDLGSIPGSGRPPGEGKGYPLQLHRGTPCTEEPGRLQSMGSQRVRHDWAPEQACTLSLCGLEELAVFVLKIIELIFCGVKFDASRLCCKFSAQLPGAKFPWTCASFCV